MIAQEAATVMQVELPIDDKAVKRAFKKLALERHPDHGGSDAAMRQLIEARDVLLREGGRKPRVRGWQEWRDPVADKAYASWLKASGAVEELRRAAEAIRESQRQRQSRPYEHWTRPPRPEPDALPEGWWRSAKGNAVRKCHCCEAEGYVTVFEVKADASFRWVHAGEYSPCRFGSEREAIESVGRRFA